MADFRPLLWDPAGPVKRRFSDTDTLELDTDGTNSIFDLKISSTSVFTLSNAGVLTHAVGTALDTVGDAAYTLTSTSGGVNGASATAGVSGLETTVTGSASDTNTALIVGYKSSYGGGGGGSNMGVGFWADSSHDLALYCQAAAFITTDDDNSALEVDMPAATTNGAKSGRFGLATADANHTGKSFSVVEVKGEGKSNTTDGGTILGLSVEYTESGTQAATTRGIDIDANWDYGVLTQSLLGFNRATTNPFMEFDGSRAAAAGGNINTDSALGETVRVLVDDGAGGFNTRWIPAFTDPDMDNIGGSGTLDEAYDASGGASLINVDAGNLTWRLSSTYNFIIDDGTNEYLNIEQNDGGVTLAASATDAGADLVLEALSTGGLFSATSAGALSLQSTGSTVTLVSNAGMTHTAGGTCQWTVNSGNFNVNCSANGTMNLDAFTQDITAVRGVTIRSGTVGAGVYGFNIQGEAQGSHYLQTTNDGDLYVWADPTSASANLDIRSGNTTITTAGGAGAYDLRLIASTTGGNGDIEFQARGSGLIPFNAAAPDNVLVGFTATSIVGALNELNAAGVPSWNTIYANDPNSNVLTVSSGGTPLQITQTSTSGNAFKVYRNLGPAPNTDAPIVYFHNDDSNDNQPCLFVESDGASAVQEIIMTRATTYGSGMVPFSVNTRGQIHTGRIYVDQAVSGINPQYTVYCGRVESIAGVDPLDLVGTGHTLTVGYNGGNSIRATGTDFDCQTQQWTFVGTSGVCTLTSGDSLNINAPNVITIQSTAQDLRLLSDGTHDIEFTARGSGIIPFNSAAPDNVLVGFTATSIIGALNELKGSGPTLDDAYNNDGGAAAIAVDAGSVTWTTSSTYEFIVNQTGTGSILDLQDNGTSRWGLADGGVLIHEPLPPTTSLTAHTLELVSDDITTASQVVVANQTNITSSGAGTTASPTYTAYQANFTNAGGTLGTLKAFEADADWTYGLYSLSPVYVNLSSGTGYEIEHTGSSLNNAIRVHDGTWDHFNVNAEGGTYIYCDSTAGTALQVDADDTGLDLLKLQDAVNSENRMLVNYAGHTEIYATQYTGSGVALKVGADDQSIEGTITVLQLGQGDEGTYTNRWSVYTDGTANIDSVGDDALDIDVTPTGDPGGSGPNLTLLKYHSPVAGTTSTAVSGYVVQFDDNSNDTCDYIAFEPLVSGAFDGSGTYTAFYVGSSSWDYGLYSYALIGLNRGTTDPFVEFDGSRATGATGNINTDSTKGESLRVTVDDGAGGFNTRWIPAFVDPDIDDITSDITLDAAYNNDGGAATVTVDAGDVTWALVGNYKTAITLTETVASQTLLDIAGTTAAASAHNLTGVLSTVNAGATSPSGDLFAYDVSTAGTTSGTKYAFHCNDAGFDYGLYSVSKAYFLHTTTANADVLHVSGLTPAASAHDVIGVNSRLAPGAGASGDCTNYYASLSGSTSGASYGYYAESTLDYGLYSQAPCEINLSSVTAATTGLYLPLNSGGAGANDLTGMWVRFNSQAGDSGTHKGFSAQQSGSSAGATAYGYYADSNWDYGSYIESPTAVYVQNITATTNVTAVVGASGGLGATGEEVTCINVNWQEHASAEVATINGIKLDLTEQALANNTKYGVKIDDSWTYGVYTSSPVYVNRSLLTSSDDGLSVIATSNNLGGVGNLVRLINLDFTSHTSDNDSVFGIDLSYTQVGGASNTSRGINIDDEWDRGWYSLSPVESYWTCPSGTTSINPLAAHYVTVRTIQTGQSAASPIGIMMDLEGNSNDTGGSVYGFRVDADDGGAASPPTYYGFYTETSSDLDYAFYANSKSYFTEVLNANGGPTYAVKVLGNTFSQTGFTSSGLYIEHLDGGTGGGFFEGITMEGDSASTAATTAIQIDNEWDLGVICASKGSYFYHTFPDTVTSTLPVLRVAATTPGTAMGASSTIYGIKETVTANAADPSTTQYYGFHTSFVPNGVSGSQIIQGIHVEGYGVYNAGKLGTSIAVANGIYIHRHPQVDGFGGYTIPIHSVEAQSGGTGLDASDKFICYRSEFDDDSDDSGDADYYGFYCLNTSPAVPASAPKHGHYVDSNFKNTDWAFHSESSRTNFYSNFGALPASTGYVHNTMTSVSGGSDATASEWNLYVNNVTHASDGDGFDFRGIQLAATDIGGASNTIGMFVNSAWDIGIKLDTIGSQAIHAVDSWIDLDVNSSVAVPGSTNGVITVDVNLDSALSGTSNGIFVDVDPNASDTGTFRAYHAEMTGTAPDAGTYYGFHVNDDYDTGFYAGSSVRTEGFYAYGIGQYNFYNHDGGMRSRTTTSTYDPTTWGTAQHYVQLISGGITSGSHYSRVSQFFEHGSDTSAASWYGYVAGTDASAGSNPTATTFGFYADSNVEYGYYSTASRSVFLINSGEHTSSGGSCVDIADNNSSRSLAALYVKASNTSSSGKVIQINDAYNSTFRGTNRTIVYQSTKRVLRAIPTSRWQSITTGSPYGATAEWGLYDSGTGVSSTNYWRTANNQAKIIIPLNPPENGSLFQVSVYVDYNSTPTSTRASLSLWRIATNSSRTATQLGSTVFATTSTLAQQIVVSGFTHTVDAATYEYVMVLHAGTKSGWTLLDAWGAQANYDITSLSGGAISS
jgi:hypothetical protein